MNDFGLNCFDHLNHIANLTVVSIYNENEENHYFLNKNVDQLVQWLYF